MQGIKFRRQSSLESYSNVFDISNTEILESNKKILQGALVFPAIQLHGDESSSEMHEVIMKNFSLAEKEMVILNDYNKFIVELTDVTNLIDSFMNGYTLEVNGLTSVLFDWVETFNLGYKFYDRYLSDSYIETMSGQINQISKCFKFGNNEDLVILNSKFSIVHTVNNGSRLIVDSGIIEIKTESNNPFIDVMINVTSREKDYGIGVRSDKLFSSDIGLSILANDYIYGKNYYPLTNDSSLVVRIYGIRDNNIYRYDNFISVSPFIKSNTNTHLKTIKFDLEGSKNTAILSSDLDKKFVTLGLSRFVRGSDKPIMSTIPVELGEIELFKKQESEKYKVLLNKTESYSMMKHGNGLYTYLIDAEVVKEVALDDFAEEIYYGIDCAMKTNRTDKYEQTFTIAGVYPILLGDIFKENGDVNMFVDVKMLADRYRVIYDSELQTKVRQYSIPIILEEKEIHAIISNRGLALFIPEEGATKPHVRVPINFMYIQKNEELKSTSIFINDLQEIDYIVFRGSLPELVNGGFEILEYDISSSVNVNMIEPFNSESTRSALELKIQPDGSTKVELIDKNIDNLDEYIEELGGRRRRIKVTFAVDLIFTAITKIYNISIFTENEITIQIPSNTDEHNIKNYRNYYEGNEIPNIAMYAGQVIDIDVYGDPNYCLYLIEELNNLNPGVIVFSGKILKHSLDTLSKSTFNKQGYGILLTYELSYEILPKGSLVYKFTPGSKEGYITPIILTLRRNSNVTGSLFEMNINSNFTGYPLNYMSVVLR